MGENLGKHPRKREEKEDRLRNFLVKSIVEEVLGKELNRSSPVRGRDW